MTHEIEGKFLAFNISSLLLFDTFDCPAFLIFNYFEACCDPENLVLFKEIWSFESTVIYEFDLIQ